MELDLEMGKVDEETDDEDEVGPVLVDDDEELQRLFEVGFWFCLRVSQSYRQAFLISLLALDSESGSRGIFQGLRPRHQEG